MTEELKPCTHCGNTEIKPLQNLETYNHNCINSPISKPNTVKHTLWWKIGTILSYLILIGMAIYMLFKE